MDPEVLEKFRATEELIRHIVHQLEECTKTQISLAAHLDHEREHRVRLEGMMERHTRILYTEGPDTLRLQTALKDAQEALQRSREWSRWLRGIVAGLLLALFTGLGTLLWQRLTAPPPGPPTPAPGATIPYWR